MIRRNAGTDGNETDAHVTRETGRMLMSSDTNGRLKRHNGDM